MKDRLMSIKQFETFCGAVRIYKKLFLNYNNIINLFEDSSKNSKNWFWKKSEQAMKVNEKQRTSIEMNLPVYKTNYSSLNLNDYEKKLIIVSADIQERIIQHVLHYANDFGLSISDSERPKVLKYTVGDFFKMHRDSHPLTPRSVSTILYLNDNYDGGELFFKYFNFMYKPEFGDLVVFPSNYAYTHESTPITNGTKYSIVNFWNERINNE